MNKFNQRYMKRKEANRIFTELLNGSAAVRVQAVRRAFHKGIIIGGSAALLGVMLAAIVNRLLRG